MLEVNEPFVRDLVEEMSLALPDSIMVEGDWVEFLWLTATPTAQPTDLPVYTPTACPLPRWQPPQRCRPLQCLPPLSSPLPPPPLSSPLAFNQTGLHALPCRPGTPAGGAVPWQEAK